MLPLIFLLFTYFLDLGVIIEDLHLGPLVGTSTKCVSIIKEQVLASCQQYLYFFLKENVQY